MLKLEYLQELLVISIALSAITCTFIQKTKSLCSCSKCVNIYSFIVNMLVGIIFCITFTSLSFPTSLWIGFFSYLGADTIYKTLEGRLSSYQDIVNKKTVTIPIENIINKEEKKDGKTNISK